MAEEVPAHVRTDQWIEEKGGKDSYPGFVRIPAPEPEPETDPLKDPLWGWKKDEDGVGYVRMPDDQLPPIPRKGTWCKIINLTQKTDMNGCIVEVISENDGLVEIQFDNEEHFLIKPPNLAPLPGSEKLGAFHKEITLQVNGINCEKCKAPLMDALCEVEGVGQCAVSITTKTESGQHPNPVILKGAIDVEKVKEAISKLDAGKGKYTVA
jgi:hypothetical protein